MYVCMHLLPQGALRAREGDEDEGVPRSAPAASNSSVAEEEPVTEGESMQQQSNQETVPVAAPQVRGTCVTKFLLDLLDSVWFDLGRVGSSWLCVYAT